RQTGGYMRILPALPGEYLGKKCVYRAEVHGHPARSGNHVCRRREAPQARETLFVRNETSDHLCGNRGVEFRICLLLKKSSRLAYKIGRASCREMDRCQG